MKITKEHLHLLLHCHVGSGQNIAPLFKQTAAKDLVDSGLIGLHGNLAEYATTSRGRAHVHQLCEVGLPIRTTRTTRNIIWADEEYRQLCSEPEVVIIREPWDHGPTADMGPGHLMILLHYAIGPPRSRSTSRFQAGALDTLRTVKLIRFTKLGTELTDRGWAHVKQLCDVELPQKPASVGISGCVGLGAAALIASALRKTQHPMCKSSVLDVAQEDLQAGDVVTMDPASGVGRRADPPRPMNTFRVSGAVKFSLLGHALKPGDVLTVYEDRVTITKSTGHVIVLTYKGVGLCR